MNGRDLQNLTTLIIDGNFLTRSKNRPKVIENLGTVLEAFPIEMLSLVSDIEKNALRSELVPLILSLIDNSRLTEINITGNLVGDPLAFAFAKVLQSNKTLKTIFFDRNNLTFSGLRRLEWALDRNETLMKMPLPYYDLNVVADRLTDKSVQELEKTLVHIQTKLAANGGKSKKEKEKGNILSNVVAEVIADYTATDPRVLSLVKGKSVQVISAVSKEWWKVEYEGQIGLAPSNHLRLPSQKKTNRKPPSRESSGESRSLLHQESTRIDLDPKLKVPKMDLDTKLGIQEARSGLKQTNIIDEKGTVKGIHEAKLEKQELKRNENKFEGFFFLAFDFFF